MHNKKRITLTPLTLPRHSDLMNEVNGMSMAIKLHHTIKCDDTDLVKLEMLERSRETCKEPTWEDITELLNKVYSVLEQERYNPVKY